MHRRVHGGTAVPGFLGLAGSLFLRAVDFVHKAFLAALLASMTVDPAADMGQAWVLPTAGRGGAHRGRPGGRLPPKRVWLRGS